MYDMKKELEYLEAKGARFIEITDGDYIGIVGATWDYDESTIIGSCVYPHIFLNVVAYDRTVYTVSRNHLKVISVDEFIEKVRSKGGGLGAYKDITNRK